MKFIAISGGLGNQMFIYAFCEELRVRDQNAVLFIHHVANLKKYGHQGYELEKLFSIDAYADPLSKLSVFLLIVYSHLLRIVPHRFRERLYLVFKIRTIMVPENFIYYPQVFDFKCQHELFRGTWQSERFFENSKKRVRKAFAFKEDLLNDETKILARQIIDETSVSIHIRRGDYLSKQYANGFAGVCTPEYYQKAIRLILDKYQNPRFYLFTDDKQWVLKNLDINNSMLVDFNFGSESWQDMFLMSKCKHNIIANSSFSWWGAWLNTNPDKIVIAPKIWWNGFNNDDVVPESWIRL